MPINFRRHKFKGTLPGKDPFLTPKRGFAALLCISILFLVHSFMSLSESLAAPETSTITTTPVEPHPSTKIKFVPLQYPHASLRPTEGVVRDPIPEPTPTEPVEQSSAEDLEDETTDAFSHLGSTTSKATPSSRSNPTTNLRKTPPPTAPPTLPPTLPPVKPTPSSPVVAGASKVVDLNVVGKDARDVMYVTHEEQWKLKRVNMMLKYLSQGNQKPILAICFPMRSKKEWTTIKSIALVRLLIPSIKKTISAKDFQKYEIRVYMAYDDDDDFWIKGSHLDEVEQLLGGIPFVAVPTRKTEKFRIPHNPVAKAAYDDLATYIVRINDDTSFASHNWIDPAVAQLAAFTPPNVGAVGPTCKEGNTQILTHDMTHRYHSDLFLYYYPPVFLNWWLDDWVTFVYPPSNTKKMPSWTVDHNMHSHGQRYTVDHAVEKQLKGELEFGGARIREFVDNEYDFNKMASAFVFKPEIQRLVITAREMMSHQVLLHGRESGSQFVILQMLNGGFLEMTKHWICSVKNMNVLRDVIFIATDQEAYDGLLKFDSSLIVVLVPSPPQITRDLSYGQVAYYKLMQFRTTVLQSLLSVGVRFLLAESDAVWLENPIPDILKKMHSGPFHLISASDQVKVNRLQGGFLLFEPCREAVNLLFNVGNKLEKVMNKIIERENNRAAKYVADEGSEQLIMESLIDTLSKRPFDGRLQPFKIGYLDVSTVASGQWYLDASARTQYPRPKVVLNNWIAGNDKKIDRAKKNNHWKLQNDHQTCK